MTYTNVATVGGKPLSDLTDRKRTFEMTNCSTDLCYYLTIFEQNGRGVVDEVDRPDLPMTNAFFMFPFLALFGSFLKG